MFDTPPLFHQYFQLTRLFAKKLNEVLETYGLFHAQWSIIYFLASRGSTTLVEISNYLHVEKPTITRTVNRLEQGNFIKQVSSSDKRERRIQLTEHGLEVYTECIKAVTKFEEKVVFGLSEEEQQAFLSYILIMQNNIQHELIHN